MAGRTVGFLVVGINKKTGGVVRFVVNTRAQARSASRGLTNVKVFKTGTPRALAKKNRLFFKTISQRSKEAAVKRRLRRG